MVSNLCLETKKRLTSISLFILSLMSNTISVLALKNGTKKTAAYHALLVDNNAGTLEAQFQNVCQQAVSHRDITDRPKAYPV